MTTKEARALIGTALQDGRIARDDARARQLRLSDLKAWTADDRQRAILAIVNDIK